MVFLPSNIFTRSSLQAPFAHGWSDAQPAIVVFFSIQFILQALSYQFTTLVVQSDNAAQVFDTVGIDLTLWRNVIGTFYPDRIVYTTTDSNYKETSNQRPANQPNNQRFIVCILYCYLYSFTSLLYTHPYVWT